MIICQTPYRISFFGGGTDYPSWYEKNGGAVLSTTINKYCYLTCRQLPPFFTHKHRFVWSRIELVNKIEETEHPSIRAVLTHFQQNEGLEIHHVGDLPAQSGIGSSSSFTVGLLNVMYALRGRMVSKQELAEQAIFIEQKMIQETIGSQDQIAAAYGGFNRIEFLRDGKFVVRPVIAPLPRIEELNRSLMMFYTGVSRKAENRERKKTDQYAGREADLKTMRGLVDDALGIITGGGSLDEFGRLLDVSWQLKRSLSDKISNRTIDDIYAAAMSAGAFGGKLLGAGGGGFMVFFVPFEKQESVRKRLHELTEIAFRFESRGSQVPFYSPAMAIYRP